MAERDDDVSRRYRALAREEPPAALDAAILAASRRAVGARPGGARRWAGPVSIAAVLVLGIGVSLRMQQERPGIETAAPTTEPAAQAPAKPAASSEVQAQAPASIAPAPPPAQKRVSPPPPPEALAKRKVVPTENAARADSSSRDAAAPDQRAPMRDPSPEPSRREEPQVAAAAPPPAPASAPAPAAAPAPALRAKSERAMSLNGTRESRAQDAIADPRTVELERIAKLRAEGRHADADRALEEFQRTHRDYRIPEAMWERVRPR
ncbi:MAG TPA: hypothetical protein VM122_11255 [Usitatibacter sp.]|nr:hypothetical protein [Usitatibacter sp.]